MQDFIKKVIRASAGTGKTYRLSLEYIALLLKFRQHGIRFSEILVITFTKKATAEIRERIFNHLEIIINQATAGAELCHNLKSIFNVDVTADDISYLKHMYHEMLLNKNLVQINTIDSFTNLVFKTIIAPYLGLTKYEIDETITHDLLAEIFQFILQDKSNLMKIHSFFSRSGRKNIEDYENFILSILNNRWIFHLVDDSAEKKMIDLETEKQAESYLTEFREKFYAVLDLFHDYVQEYHPQRTLTEIFKKNYFELFFYRLENVPVSDFSHIIKEKLNDTDFIRKHQKILLATMAFWNGAKIFRKMDEIPFSVQIKEAVENAYSSLAEYFYVTDLLQEQDQIKEIATLILTKYDEIKFRDRVFTFNDISYYTFKYLYDPELSLIAQDVVTNAFYEYLSSSLRFILIDEFQDTSIIQFKILYPIIKEVTSGYGVKNYGGTIVVGDEKQSIYGWRGGERDLLLSMPFILHDAEEITLDTSYRSDENIIHFINMIFSDQLVQETLLAHRIEWPYDEVKTVRKGKTGCIQIHYRNYANTKDDDNDISQEHDAIREFVEQTLIPLIKQKKISVAKSAILARKNRDLQHIAAILDEAGIDYVLESSHSILNHRAIKPLIYLFRFMVYRDIMDLLKFLRSDYVLIDAHHLKEILMTLRHSQKEHKSFHALFTELSHIEAIQKFNKTIGLTFKSVSSFKNDDMHDVLIIAKIILEEYHVLDLFRMDNDVKNINLFLTIIAHFQNSNLAYPRSLKGFLDYCADYEEHESFQQTGLENIDAINLLSIHKSKGLEFENVFLYWNLSGRSAGFSGSLNSYLEYSQNFLRLENYVITSNFDHILPHCHEKELKKAHENKAAIEELNTLYVAMTRTKRNLFIYFSYQKAGGLETFFNTVEDNDKIRVDRLLALSIYQRLMSQGQLKEVNNNYTYAELGELTMYDEKKQLSAKRDFSYLKNYLEVDRSKYLVKDEKRIAAEKYIDFKSVYIKKKNIEKGNIAHYYLSFIHYATEKEKKQALKRTLSYYGNLLASEDIKAIIQHVNQFIDDHASLFSPTKWSNVFTEFTIYSPHGKELRLDRLMIDERHRELRIVDYKTGDIYEVDQLSQYIEAVNALPVVQKGNYKVSGEYVMLDV